MNDTEGLKHKIGVLTDSKQLKKWQFDVISGLQKLVNVEVKLILNSSGSPLKNRKSAGMRFHEWIDRILYTNFFSYDISYDVTNVPQLTGVDLLLFKDLVPDRFALENGDYKKNQSSSYFDLIINFSNISITDEIIGLTEFGVWEYQIGECLSNGQNIEGYWEIVTKKHELKIQIVSRATRGIESCVFQTYISTYPHSFLVNRNKGYYLAQSYFKLAIDSFLREKNVAYDAGYSNGDFPVKGKGLKLPGTIKAFGYMVVFYIRYFSNKIWVSSRRYWFLLYRFSDQSDVFHPVLEEYKPIIPPAGHLWADPFPMVKDAKYYIFFEDIVTATRRGHIGCAEIDKMGNVVQTFNIIQNPYHMSYPFLIEFGNDLLMIPETSENKTIDVYKCVQFPDQWEFLMNIMVDISAKDTTFFYYKNLWWMFTSIQGANENDVSALHLYFAGDLLTGKWESHPLNPIVLDVKYERAAGNIFMQEGRLYRVSQDCSGIYGKAVNISEITVLSESEYQEKPVSTMAVKGNSLRRGIHTFNFYKDLTVIDVFKKGSRFRPGRVRKRVNLVYKS